MSTLVPSASALPPEQAVDAITLRPSGGLGRLPMEPPESPAPASPTPASPIPARKAPAGEDPGVLVVPTAEAPPPSTAQTLMGAPPAYESPPLPQDAGGGARTVLLGGSALLATLGWVFVRRQRRAQVEKDSVLWARVQPPSASLRTIADELDQILPDGPSPAEAARAIYVQAVGETTSRREATVTDLQELQGKLRRRTLRGDNVAAVLLLQQHLTDFRYTSPWVFLELRELYKVLDRPAEWEVAREAFRQRFGQNAPLWTASSTAGAELISDLQLANDLVRYWRRREARVFILNWMLGNPEMRRRSNGPPLLPLGFYRDLLLLDQVLDDVMMPRALPPTDSDLTTLA